MKKTVIIAAALFFCLAPASFAAEGAAAPARAGAENASGEMTKEELAADIQETLNIEESIAGLIPGFKKEKDAVGKEYYTYQGARLEAINKDDLNKLRGRVRGEASRIRTDKLNRQLESIRRMNAQRTVIPQSPRASTRPITASPVSQVPKIPKTYQAPKQTPAIPASTKR